MAASFTVLKSLSGPRRPNFVSWGWRRNVTTTAIRTTFQSSNLKINFAGPNEVKPKPSVLELGFGKTFTDHMLTVEWTNKTGWKDPEISPIRPFQLHPAAKVLHYAQELFEGMKAYRGIDDQIRMFRPMYNMARMNASAKRACLPNFDSEEMLQCIRRLVQLEQEWVPHCESSSLYIRPTMIGVEPTLGVGTSNHVYLYVLLSPVGPYFAEGRKPVKLLADPRFVRAWPGGSGYAKMGSNYAPTLYVQKLSEAAGCQQCLWLVGEDHEITEVGAMNIFVVLRKPNSEDIELVTPSLDKGVILPGITRNSILHLTRQWNEFEVNERKITMGEVIRAKEEGRLVEVFGAGTAAIVSQVGDILYSGKNISIPTHDRSAVSLRILKAMTDIYYGHIKHPWTVEIEDWPEESLSEASTLKEYQDSIDSYMVLN